MDKLNDEFFDKIYEACNQDCKILWSSFAIINKDLNEFICNNALSCTGIDCFQSVYTSTISGDRLFYQKCSPQIFLCLKDPEVDLDCNITTTAKGCEFILPDLEEKATANQSWLAYPGWALMNAFWKKFKAQLCDSDIPFRSFEDNQIDKKELVREITRYLLENVFTQDTLWYPFIIYLSILIVKTVSPPFCGEGNENCC